MKLPFTLQNVLETMIDRPIGLYSNFPSSNEYRRFSEITLLQDGKILRSGNDVGTWGMWGVLNGVLRLMSEKGYLSIEFRTLETRNESVYAVGRNVQEPVGTHRVILQIKQPVTTFGVCISSHVNYEKVAVPRILKSLEGDGFDMSKVIVVIGSDKENGMAAEGSKTGAAIRGCMPEPAHGCGQPSDHRSADAACSRAPHVAKGSDRPRVQARRPDGSRNGVGGIP